MDKCVKELIWMKQLFHSMKIAYIYMTGNPIKVCNDINACACCSKIAYRKRSWIAMRNVICNVRTYLQCKKNYRRSKCTGEKLENR